MALDRLVEIHHLGSMAYYYMGTGNPENEDAISSIILGNCLLTARGIPVAGEMEIKNVQAMKILDTFGVGGSFTEYYAMDFNDDVVLMGHDGPGHIAIAEGKTKVRPLQVYHGKVGRGLSVEMSVKHGPVTLLSVVQTGERRLKLLVAEGESVPGPILEIGNTNSRYRFPIGARDFVNEWNGHGPAHHCAVGVGHVAAKIEKLGEPAGHGGGPGLLMDAAEPEARSTRNRRTISPVGRPRRCGTGAGKRVPQTREPRRSPNMDANPPLGVMLHAIGGLAAASFYIPYKRVNGWSWETYWLVGGVFSWILAPWAFSLAILPQTVDVLRDASGTTLFWTFFFGVLWGVGGLTFGLTMRYLGIALGYAHRPGAVRRLRDAHAASRSPAISGRSRRAARGRWSSSGSSCAWAASP